MRPGDGWVWGASGKHPAVKDYISLGGENPVLGALSRWVEQGFSKVSGPPAGRSWRFFTRGLKPGELACGLLRDSSDGAGRVFPLLMAGYGRMDGWEKHWDSLPRACDRAWESMEFLCVKRLFDLGELKGDIARLPRPSMEDAAAGCEASGSSPAQAPAGLDVITLGLPGEGDHRDEAALALKRIREQDSRVPAAVFIGGARDRILLIVFMRSLNHADFGTLWTM